MTGPYPNLLSPLDLGFTTLRNRVIMGRCTPDWRTGPRYRPVSACASVRVCTQTRRAGLAFRGRSRTVSVRSGLLERLDLQRDGDLVADDGAAGLQRQVDVDPEVLAVQHD
jgi:hypothetical protein